MSIYRWPQLYRFQTPQKVWTTEFTGKNTMSRFTNWVKRTYVRVKKWVKNWFHTTVEPNVEDINDILAVYGLKVEVDEAERSEADNASEASIDSEEDIDSGVSSAPDYGLNQTPGFNPAPHNPRYL